MFALSKGYNLPISPAQCRMARAALQLGVREIALAAGLSAMTVTRFENGHSRGYDDTVDKLQRAFEAAGVEFTNGGQPGVRLTLVGALHQLCGSADLDTVLKIKGMKGTFGNVAKFAKTPWQIVCTTDGVECHNADGIVVYIGSVRPSDSGLIFDPEMVGVPYDDMPNVTKLQNWVGLMMNRDAANFQASNPPV